MRRQAWPDNDTAEEEGAEEAAGKAAANRHWAESPGARGAHDRQKSDIKVFTYTCYCAERIVCRFLPRQLNHDDIMAEKQTAEYVVLVNDILEREGGEDGINLFKFLINPHSFTQTVENIFFTSFLVRDNKASIEVPEDGDGVPIICELCDVTRKRSLEWLFVRQKNARSAEKPASVLPHLRPFPMQSRATLRRRRTRSKGSPRGSSSWSSTWPCGRTRSKRSTLPSPSSPRASMQNAKLALRGTARSYDGMQLDCLSTPFLRSLRTSAIVKGLQVLNNVCKDV